MTESRSDKNEKTLNRRQLMGWLSATGIGTAAFHRALAAQATRGQQVTVEMVRQAEWISGIELTHQQRTQAASGLTRMLSDLDDLRSFSVGYDTWPAIKLHLQPGQPARNNKPEHQPGNPPTDVPADDEDLAFLPLRQQHDLLRRGEITATHLTEVYLRRLKKYDPTLKFVVNLTEQVAMEKAKLFDAAKPGRLRNLKPLSGIPYGAKDLMAYPGYPTTWGAPQFSDRVIDHKAHVLEKLDADGAVLVAKLSLGALAMGDKWYGGPTLNPWNITQGSSGSSAGSASATAAGCVGFSIGSETLGSIISPSIRCGVTGLRPTFGRVSRDGCMALSWSMDKLGPICRSADDCGFVFEAIQGKGGDDPSAVDMPFAWPRTVELKNLKVGYIETAQDVKDREELQILKEHGVKLVPIKLPTDIPTRPLVTILFAEAASQFDPLTREGIEEGLNSWPAILRRSEYIPAVEYIRAQRIRSRMQERMQKLMSEIDFFVSSGGDELVITNMTGHPSIAMPSGFRENQDGFQPESIQFVGRLFDEVTILNAAKAFQQQTDYHLRRPPLVTEKQD
ncbi:MAG: amidase [Planctomycetaceae bacterium]|nr:amidase [Planctomycetaceae bacterium]|tara:strand:+ start:1194 stop:2885 length:1692 start_codon:yes stop_codon:yes gene_type:complete